VKAYLAAPYAAREVMRAYAEQLTYLDLDVVCCSSWLDKGPVVSAGTVGPASDLDDPLVNELTQAALADIAAADALVLFTAASLGLPVEAAASGGRHVETGYALALRVPVLVVGEPENVFHRSGRVTRVRDWSAAVGVLGGVAIGMRRAEEPAYVAEQWACPACVKARLLPPPPPPRRPPLPNPGVGDLRGHR
jgi:hypothetical protein